MACLTSAPVSGEGATYPPGASCKDGATYPSREGLHLRDERRAAPSRPAVPVGDGATYPSREGLH